MSIPTALFSPFSLMCKMTATQSPEWLILKSMSKSGNCGRPLSVREIRPKSAVGFATFLIVATTENVPSDDIANVVVRADCRYRIRLNLPEQVP